MDEEGKDKEPDAGDKSGDSGQGDKSSDSDEDDKGGEPSDDANVSPEGERDSTGGSDDLNSPTTAIGSDPNWQANQIVIEGLDSLVSLTASQASAADSISQSGPPQIDILALADKWLLTNSPSDNFTSNADQPRILQAPGSSLRVSGDSSQADYTAGDWTIKFLNDVDAAVIVSKTGVAGGAEALGLALESEVIIPAIITVAAGYLVVKGLEALEEYTGVVRPVQK